MESLLIINVISALVPHCDASKACINTIGSSSPVEQGLLSACISACSYFTGKATPPSTNVPSAVDTFHTFGPAAYFKYK